MYYLYCSDILCIYCRRLYFSAQFTKLLGEREITEAGITAYEGTIVVLLDEVILSLISVTSCILKYYIVQYYFICFLHVPIL